EQEPTVLVRLVPEAEVDVRVVVELPLSIELLGRRRRRGRRRIGWDAQLPVVLEPGTGRNQPSHRDVLLQAAQVVDLARDRRLGEHAGRLLERRGRDERLGRQRRLRDAEQQRAALGRLSAPGEHALVLLLEAELVDLLLDEELGGAGLLDLHPPHHLADDDLDVLVIDADALQPVDLLDLVDQVGLQLALAEHGQDVVRVARAVHERLTGTDAVALLHVDVHAARQRVLARLAAVVGHDEDLPHALDDAAVAHRAVDLGDDRGLARLARLEQLDHARQTAGDVLGLGRLARNLRQHVAGVDRLAVGHHEVGVRRHVVAVQHLAVGADDLDRRLLLLVRRVDDDQARQTGDLVEVLVDGHLVDDVLEADRAAALGKDRERVRIPLDEGLTALDLLAVADLQVRAVDDRVALADDAVLVDDVDRAGAVHHDERRARLAGLGLLASLHVLDAVELDRALVPRLQRRLLGDPRRGAADVERPHRQLRAGLADRLRRDDADRQAELDEPAGGQVAAVALGADAAPRGAGEHRADLHALDTGVLDALGERLVDLAAGLDDDRAGRGIEHRLERHTADDAVAEALDNLAARVDNRPQVEAVERAAVDLLDDDVLRHVDQTPREVARVGRLERRVGQPLARAVRRDEVLEHREPFTEVRRDGRLDDLARRLGHQAAHARQLADLLLAAARARVGHDVDRVEATPRPVARLHLAEHGVGNPLGDFRPDRDDLVLALAVRDRAFLVLAFDADDLVAGRLDELDLLV